MFSLYFLPAQQGAAKRGRTLGWSATAAVLAALIAYGLLSNKLEDLNTLGVVFMYVVITQAWNILGAGAYTSALLFHFFGLSPFLTAPLAGAAAGLLAFIIGIPTLRLRGAYFAVVTMIITFAMQILVLDLPFTQGALGVYLTPLDLDPRATEQLFYFVFLGCAVAMTVLIYFVENSNFGWALVAIREDEDAAEIIGVRTTAVKWIGNAVACFATGVVGGIYAQRILYIEPTSTFSLDVSLNVVLMAVIGGAGTWQGPLIGAPLVLIVAEALRVTVTSEVNRVIFSLIVIGMALYMPRGLMGLLKRTFR